MIKRRKVDVFIDDDFSDEPLSVLLDIIQKLIEAYGADAVFKVCSDDYNIQYMIERYETDEEMAERAAREAEREQDYKESRRRQYEQLRREFENETQN